VAVWLGNGGYVPHDAATILENGYGDCKDHVALLGALLKAKGIASEPVLINSGNRYTIQRGSGRSGSKSRSTSRRVSSPSLISRTVTPDTPEIPRRVSSVIGRAWNLIGRLHQNVLFTAQIEPFDLFEVEFPRRKTRRRARRVLLPAR
jgi:transglutaminase-like putative cysteine protease